MFSRCIHVFLIYAATLLLAVLSAGCGDRADTVKDDVGDKVDAVKEDLEEVREQAGVFFKLLQLSTESCEDLLAMSVDEDGGREGWPGVSGSPRWGIPDAAPAAPRVRRSWSSLSDAEKKQVVDGFVRLKQTTVGSGAAGAERADYGTLCEGDGAYARNLYDYYVELHGAAYAQMGTDQQPMSDMPHMGPKFLPWHRYLLLRIEADLQDVLGDPDFALPYWDWEDCGPGTDDGSNPCPALFEDEFLGSHGSCEDEGKEVTGYLVDQGFETHIWSAADETNFFNVGGLRCSTKPLQREVGCSQFVDGQPPTAEDAAGIFDRQVYDVEPYDSCNTDEDVSMRQYIEGFTQDDRVVACVFGGCETHGRGHFYVGGDMAGQAVPNEPVFFLHHNNIDRLWALWQDRNRESADTAADYGNPGYPDDWRGALFNFDEVRADEMFDFRALGFTYDTNE